MITPAIWVYVSILPTNCLRVYTFLSRRLLHFVQLSSAAIACALVHFSRSSCFASANSQLHRLTPVMSFSVLYLINHMFTVQFFHGQKAEWRSTGSGTFFDKSHAIQRMRSMSEMCDHSVRFRVTESVAL